jgi:outer membrane protein assembly factor BamB
LVDGYVSWEKNLRDEFPLQGDLPWGYCGSPLLVDGKLIVAPGAAAASLIAIDPDTGELKWKTPGAPPSYGSLTAGVLGGVKQIVGHDADTLGGWDIETGERLWTVKPDAPGDFNVPTPIVDAGQLIVATENNATRRFDFDQSGRILVDPVAGNANLRPDMSTPVVVGNRLFCVKDFLYCLDVDGDLAERWRIRDRAIGDYAAIIASQDRLMVIGKGELLLLRTDGGQQIIARQKVFGEKVNIYSHPALVGNRLFIRGESKLLCIQL